MSVNTDPVFWEGKRVFMTGHTGFKGAWASLWLSRMGSRVAGFSLEPPSEPSLFETAGIENDLEHHFGDIRDFDALSDAMESFRPEIIFHMAAQSLVRRSYEEPQETFATNVMGTVNLLEAARNLDGLKAVVIVTSDKCYENREQPDMGYNEDDRMGGFDPYSSSKGCAELATNAYRLSFFNPERYGEHGVGVASVRAGNVIGGGDWAKDRLLPDIVRAFIKEDPVTIRHPGAIRPWQHVLDPVNGYFVLAQKLWDDPVAAARGWNFGPDPQNEQSVETIVKKAIQLWGPGASWNKSNEEHVHEATYLKLDCAKAFKELGWRPHLPLDDALRLSIDWYRAFAGNKPGIDR
ncbi:MAG: CDP-glucose 4,6-dehydratase, partial [Rhodospirillales bacterium]|nr:CDP-glucose 4,6-dehydratase [Rhodospirillales bacterium]